MNSWPRSEALGATVKFWGQSLVYQQARKGFIYFIPCPLFSMRVFSLVEGKKVSGDQGTFAAKQINLVSLLDRITLRLDLKT